MDHSDGFDDSHATVLLVAFGGITIAVAVISVPASMLVVSVSAASPVTLMLVAGIMVPSSATVTLQASILYPSTDLHVITAFPMPTEAILAVSGPVGVTVATSELFDVHTTLLSVAFDGVTVTVICPVLAIVLFPPYLSDSYKVKFKPKRLPHIQQYIRRMLFLQLS
jgi:hypothetical protein